MRRGSGWPTRTGSSRRTCAFVARLVRSGGFYRPDALLEGIAPTVADPAANITGFHLYLFNAVEVTETLAAGQARDLGVAMSEPPTRDDLLASLADFPDRVAAAVRGAIARPDPPGEWTTEQVVRHLVAVETDVHQARLRDLATIDAPRWTWTEPGPWSGEPDLDLDGVLATVQLHSVARR